MNKSQEFQPDYNSIRLAYSSLIEEADMAQIMQAANWYNEAQGIAKQFAIRHDTTLSKAAGIIAAFSPRTKWASNVLNAELFLCGENVPTLGNNIRMATNVIENGISALKGRKTNSFAKNIAGNLDVVTIDTWMIRAAGYDRQDSNKSMYDLMESVIIDLAIDYNVKPAHLQALIWIVIRGSHV